MATLLDLAKDLFAAKRSEDEAKTKRIAAEEAIAALVETDDNGSKTMACGEGLKVVVKRSLSYDADVEIIRGINFGNYKDTTAYPLKLVPAQAASYEFDEAAYEKLRTLNPTIFALVAQHVTTKPRKVSVTLKLG